jgi:hypothetical protein
MTSKNAMLCSEVVSVVIIVQNQVPVDDTFLVWIEPSMFFTVLNYSQRTCSLLIPNKTVQLLGCKVQ